MKKTITFTKEQINAAIYTVLTSQFKNRAPQAFQIVEFAGYKYSKCGASFEVYNPNKAPENRKWIRLEDMRTYREYNEETKSYESHNFRIMRVQGQMYDGRCQKIWKENFHKVDYVAILESDINRVYCEVRAQQYEECSQAVHTYQYKIRGNRRMAQSYQEDIESCKKQIEKLQDKMLKYMEYKMEYEQKVIEAKKELGLRK